MEIFPLFSTPVAVWENIGVELDLSFLDELQTYHLQSGTATGSANHHVLDLPVLSGLKREILFHIDEYLFGALQFKDCNPEIISSWINFHRKGDSLAPHSHMNSLYSGVYYLKAEGNVSPIQFEAPQSSSTYCSWTLRPEISESNIFNSTDFMVNPTTGSLVLFPSHCIHSVPISTQTEERVVIAFNIWINGDYFYDTAAISMHAKPIDPNKMTAWLKSKFEVS